MDRPDSTSSATGRIYGVQPDAALKLATTQLAKVRAEIGKIIVRRLHIANAS